VLKRYYALQVLRKHGLCYSSLHTIFRPVAAAKLLYASSALSMPLTANRILHLFTAVSALFFCAPDLANFCEFYILSWWALVEKKIPACPLTTACCTELQS